MKMGNCAVTDAVPGAGHCCVGIFGNVAVGECKSMEVKHDGF